MGGVIGPCNVFLVTNRGGLTRVTWVNSSSQFPSPKIAQPPYTQITLGAICITIIRYRFWLLLAVTLTIASTLPEQYSTRFPCTNQG